MVTTEIFVAGAWQNINADVRTQDDIVVKRGRTNEAEQADPATCGLRLNNRSGRYSLRNPLSDLFGKINRNTPLRVRVGERVRSLSLPGVAVSYASTSDDPSLDITGDLDVRIEIEPETWRPSEFTALIRKYLTTGDQRSWHTWITPSGDVEFRWSPDGTFTNAITVFSTVPVPEASKRLALRVTLDVDNGAAGNDVTFFTAPSIAGPWTQLGAVVTTSGTTSIFASTAELQIGRGAFSSTFDEAFIGDVFAAEVRNGIDGPTVATPDFAALEPGTREFTDAAGRPWTLNGTAAILDSSIQFAGEVSAWPTRRHRSGNDATVKVTASDITRRLGQGKAALRSSLFRDLSTKDNVVAYWPLEDGKTATQFAAGRQGHGPLTIRSLEGVKLADYDGFVASAPLPTLTTMATGNISGNLPPYAPAQDQRVFMLVHVPEEGIATPTQRHLFSVFTQSNEFHRWQVLVNTDGALLLQVLDSDGIESVPLTAPIGFDLNGKNAVVSLWLHYPVGSGEIDWQLSQFDEGSAVGGVFGDSTIGRTESGPRPFTRVAPGSPTGLDGTALGHIGFLNDDVDGAFWGTILNSLVAWSGETAGDRLIRLATEENIPLVVTGDAARTERMGPQRRDTIMKLLRECSAVDLGVFASRRDQRALWYRTRDTLYNQEPALVLDWASGQVFPPFEPVPDDQLVRNDVTVFRPDGSEARAVLEDGPLSVKDPEDGGIGRYATRTEVNAASDLQLVDQAGWRLHLGTVDEERYPKLHLDLTSPRMSHLISTILALDEGDVIHIVDTPELVPDPIELIVQGIAKNLNVQKASVTLTCTPATPWTIGEVAAAGPADDGPQDPVRVDTNGSETAASFGAGVDTSLSVATTVGDDLWTTDLDDMPFDVSVSGVVLRVTAIIGAASPQTFTVQQDTVNGVVKTIPAGEDVRLTRPMIVAL